MPLRPSADRNAPAPVAPVRLKGLRYEAPASARGTVIAFDEKSGKEKWRVLVVDAFIDPALERDVQEVYVTKLEAQADPASVLVEDEHGRVHRLDVDTRAVSIARWPVTTRVLEWKETAKGWRYVVRLSISNGLTQPLRLDPFSVAAKGDLTNNLFTVAVDGAPMPYTGELMSRLPVPEKDLIVVKPGGTYEVSVDLSDAYAVPAGSHEVTVGFEHTNHIKRGFRLSTSSPHIVRFQTKRNKE